MTRYVQLLGTDRTSMPHVKTYTSAAQAVGKWVPAVTAKSCEGLAYLLGLSFLLPSQSVSAAVCPSACLWDPYLTWVLA